MSEFLAEAKVLIRPDTTTFRRELLTQIQDAVRSVEKTVPPIKIPVVASATAAQATQQLSKETKKAADSQKVLGAETQKLSTAQRKQVSAATAAARAEAALQSAQRQQGTLTLSQVTATSAVAKARADLSAATAVTRTAIRANEAAVISENAAIKSSTAAFLAQAQAREADALATYQQAAASEQASRSRAKEAGSRELALRGAGATGLAALGARGATLAASGQFLAGAAVAVGALQAVKSAANLEKQLNVLRVTSGATAKEMKAVADEARALGRDVNLPGVSARDAAQAMTELSKAGLDVQNSIDGARGVLQLATAAEIETAQATELVANALNAFGLAGTEATRVADVLANASVEAQGSIVDVGLGLKQSAAVARQVGVSLEDTVSLLALLAKNGISGSDAGTSLRTALIRLDAPTDKAAETLAKLDVRIRDVQGNIRPEAFAELGVALQDLSVEERALARRDIFGQDAIRAFSIFSREGVDGLRAMQDASAKTGTSLELSAAQTEGFTGSLENLKNQADSLATALGTPLLQPLGLVVDLFAEGVGGAADFATGITELAKGLNELQRNQPDLEIFGQEIDFGDLDRRVNEAVLNAVKDGIRGLPARTLFGPLGKDLADALGQAFGDNAADGIEGAEDEIRSGFAFLGAAVEEDARNTGLRLGTILMEAIASAIRSAQAPIRQAAAEARLAIASLQSELVDIEFRGGGRDVELDALRALKERQERLVEVLIARGAPRAKIDAAKQDAIQTQSRIDAILADIAADQDRAARDAEQRANDIKTARDKADRAILDALGLRESGILARQAAAELTPGLRDDVKFALALRNFLEGSEKAIRRIKDPKVRAEALADLARNIVAAKEKVVEAYQDIKDAREEERQAREDARIERLELDVQIAEAIGNQAAQIKAQQVLVRDLQRRFNLSKKGSIERKRLKLALEQERAELRELKEEVAKRNNAFAELSFEFLQAQQGFAANLLGNLIPLGATGGLVGNVSAPTAGGSGGFVYPGVTQPNVGPGAIDQGIFDQGALQAGSRQGPTAGQMATLIQINQRMLTALEGVKRGTGRPEVAFAWKNSVGGQNFEGIT